MADDKYLGQEHRKLIRFNEQIKVRYTILGTKVKEIYGEAIEAVTHNISAGGMCFDTQEHLSSGTLLKIQVKLPQTKSLIQAFGKVIWQQRDGRKKYKTGVAFFWIAEEDYQAMVRGDKK